MALLVLESIGWIFDGRIGNANAVIYTIINVMFYVLNPLPPFLWTLYADFQVYRDEKRIRKLIYPFMLPLIINGFMSLINPLTGLMFYLDQNNFYHRGSWFPLLVVASYSYLFYTIILVLYNWRSIERQNFAPLMLFSIPPFAGGLLQTTFYGLALIWSGMTLSLLIFYFNMQNRKLKTDYLTGVSNRMQFDKYLRYKIRNSTEKNSFSGILIDIDNFKLINDHYGHCMGDEALEITAQLLKRNLRKDDLLARYGGDEFIVICNLQQISDLKKLSERIHESISNYNLISNKPFKLSLSLGYDVYDYSSGMTDKQFIKHIDELMYENKKRNKEKRDI